MKRPFAVLLALMLMPFAAEAADEEWATVSRALSLAQTVLAAALASAPGDTRRSDEVLESIVGGRNPDANALAGDLLADMPPDVRAQFAAMARSALALSRRQAQSGAQGGSQAGDVRQPGASRLSERAAIEARKDLAAMGHTYHDANQFLDSVRRDDRIAARLFVAGRGLDAMALERARAAAASAGMKAILILSVE